MSKYLMLSLFLTNIAFASIKIEGKYECSWPNASTGKTVKGLIILKKTGQTYAMKSGFDDKSSYKGTGIYNDKTHDFVLVYQNPNDLKDSGVSITQFNESKNTTWTWADMNSTKIEHTYCVKQTS